MQSPLPQITSILLLVHLGLGCCFHHAHACELGCCEFETAQPSGCEEHSHSPVEPAARLECDQARLGIEHEANHSHECSGGDCTFIAVRPRWMSSIEEASHISSLMVRPLGHAVVAPRSELLANGTARDLARCTLPRTHLTLQVWQL